MLSIHNRADFQNGKQPYGQSQSTTEYRVSIKRGSAHVRRIYSVSSVACAMQHAPHVGNRSRSAIMTIFRFRLFRIPLSGVFYWRCSWKTACGVLLTLHSGYL
jgi:hypothetical protein